MSYSFMVLSQQSLLRGLLRRSLCATHSAEWVADYATVDDFLAAGSRSEALIVDCDTCRINEPQADAIVRSGRVRRVVFLTDTHGTFHVHCLFYFGFHGVLHKRDSVEEFDAGMSAVLAGSIFISAHVRAGERVAFTRVLSEREIAALRSMALHSTLRSAAEELGVLRRGCACPVRAMLRTARTASFRMGSGVRVSARHSPLNPVRCASHPIDSRRARGGGVMDYTFAICSHETLLRQASVSCLERDVRARCVAEFSSSADLDRTPVGTDLLLLDVDGSEELFPSKWQTILGSRRPRRVLLLTGAPGGYPAHLVWMNSWHGLLHKSDTFSAVRDAIDRVLEGGVSLSPNAEVSERKDFSRVLSERESELLREMACDEDLKLVARRLGLSVATVRTHRRNIFRKLNLRTQAGVVRFALRSDLLSLHAFIGHQ